MNLKILYLFAKVFSATLRGVASLGGNISKQSVKVSPQKSERFLPRKFPASLYIHTQVVMRYGGTCKPPLAIAEYCLLTSMMLKNSASCSIGSLKSSLSMCDKMVAGKKYLVCVCMEGV